MKRGSKSRTDEDDKHSSEHSPTSLQLKERLGELRKSIFSEAQQIIHEAMPKKVHYGIFFSEFHSSLNDFEESRLISIQSD